MRVIAGSRKGHTIAAPYGLDTRPTSDRVRENVFNLVGPLDGSTVLDLYAGSGALGIEALSRGAARAHRPQRRQTVLAQPGQHVGGGRGRRRRPSMAS